MGRQLAVFAGQGTKYTSTPGQFSKRVSRVNGFPEHRSCSSSAPSRRSSTLIYHDDLPLFLPHTVTGLASSCLTTPQPSLPERRLPAPPSSHVSTLLRRYSAHVTNHDCSNKSQEDNKHGSRHQHLLQQCSVRNHNSNRTCLTSLSRLSVVRENPNSSVHRRCSSSTSYKKPTTWPSWSGNPGGTSSTKTWVCSIHSPPREAHLLRSLPDTNSISDKD